MDMRVRDAVVVGLFSLPLFTGCGGESLTSVNMGSALAERVETRNTITHVVIISQENRTYDDLFGGYAGGPVAYPGGDGTVPSSITPDIKPTGFDTDPGYNAHDWYRCLQVNRFSSATWDDLKHGRWPTSPVPCPTVGPPYNPDARKFDDSSSLTIIDDAHRATYVRLAQEFEISDNYYAVQDADSFAGHQFIVALRSHNDLHQIIAGTPTEGDHLLHCTSPVGDDVKTPVLNRITGFTDWQFEGESGACWNGATFADRLEFRRITWRHYSTDDSGVFNGFINFASWYPKTDPHVAGSHFRLVLDHLQADIANNDLPQFTWVKPPCVALSDHPGRTHDPYGGSDWVASVVNWIGNNPSLWPHTVIFVVWDDWGGFYDHRTPPQPGWLFDSALTPGMRQPFIAISAYDRFPGTVMHGYATYASVLRFTEDLYGIPPLNFLDATAPPLHEYFDFHKPPKAFKPIAYSERDFDPHSACKKYVGIKPYEVDR
jgi:phospholipase C